MTRNSNHKQNGHKLAATEPRPKTHQEDPLLTQSDAAQQLGHHPVTIGRWVKLGMLKGIIMPSGLLMIRQSEVDRWLNNEAKPNPIEELIADG